MTRQYQYILSWVFTCLFGMAIGYKLALFYSPSRGPAAQVISDDRIIAGGQKYRRMLGKAYGDAWTKGALSLDHGAALGDVMQEIGKEWQAGRDKAYAETITPVLNSVVPEGTPDREITVTQRAQLATGFRKFATGLAN